jgi:hypothetical protein
MIGCDFILTGRIGPVYSDAVEFSLFRHFQIACGGDIFL